MKKDQPGRGAADGLPAYSAARDEGAQFVFGRACVRFRPRRAFFFYSSDVLDRLCKAFALLK
jgi:hypothetical protein